MAKKRTLKKRATAPSAGAKKTLKKAPAKSRPNELRQIERMLGEEFDNLSQARRAIKKESTPVKKQLPKQLKKIVSHPLPVTPQKQPTNFKPIPPTKLSQPHVTIAPSDKVWTLRDIRDGDKRAVTDYLEDRLNANALDKILLKPGERYAVQVTYRYRGTDGKMHDGLARSFDTYPNAVTMFRKLSGYGAKSIKMNKTQRAAWLNQIKIFKLNNSESDKWQAKAIAEQHQRAVRRKKVSREYYKKKGGK